MKNNENYNNEAAYLVKAIGKKKNRVRILNLFLAGILLNIFGFGVLYFMMNAILYIDKLF